MSPSIPTTENPAPNWPLWRIVRTAIVIISVVLVSGTFGVKFILHALLVQQATSSGMDWAHHIEARVLTMSEKSDHSGKPVTLKAPPTKEFTDMVNGMFAVGNIYQVDVINPDCYCDISLGSFAAKTGHAQHATSAQHDHSAGKAVDSHHGKPQMIGQLNKAEALPQPIVKHIFESESKHSSSTFGGNAKERWPIDRATVRSIVEAGKQRIFIREGIGGNQPTTFAEVFHPVVANGQASFILRILVDLEEQKAQYLDVLQRGAVLVVFLLIGASGYPAIRYFGASRRQAIANHKARFLAKHDVLTGISNRNAFQEEAPKILQDCERNGQAALLVQFDLNRFKEINDHCGHATGDHLLQQLALWLKSSMPEHALVARLGGDEFVVVIGELERSSIDGCDLIALPKELSFYCSLTRRTIAATVSGGSARFPRDGTTIDELMRNADLALYDAKSLELDHVRKFDQKLRTDFETRIVLREEFKTALENAEVEPFYQPIVDLESGRVEGLEALARWRHPKKGLLTPFSFEELLADREIGQMVGTLMFERIVADMKAWKSAEVPFGSVALNVGEGDLMQPTFAQDITSTLTENGLEPSDFAIEVTETCMFGNSKADFVHQLKHLRASGCQIALDDFGTGYSSITQLKELPCTVVKIDKSFVRDVEFEKADRAIIEAMVKLGQMIEFKVVLEGVETAEQRDLLQSMGCTVAQGFYYARPVPAGDVPTLIERLNQTEADHRRAVIAA